MKTHKMLVSVRPSVILCIVMRPTPIHFDMNIFFFKMWWFWLNYCNLKLKIVFFFNLYSISVNKMISLFQQKSNDLPSKDVIGLCTKINLLTIMLWLRNNLLEPHRTKGRGFCYSSHYFYLNERSRYNIWKK